jgi:hypothetical protein
MDKIRDRINRIRKKLNDISDRIEANRPLNRGFKINFAGMEIVLHPRGSRPTWIRTKTAMYGKRS